VTDIYPRPHHYTLVLAIAAFIVSGTSLWYSHKAYRLSVETSRSVLDIKIDLLNDWTFDMHGGENQKPINTRITLFNNGKSVIAGILMDVYPVFCYESTNIDAKSGAHLRPCIGEKNNRNEIDAEDIGPGNVRQVIMRPKVHYVDAVSGTVRTYCLMTESGKNVFSGTMYPCPSTGQFRVDDLLQLLKDDRSQYREP
jgi:hypothetical protein